MRSRNPKMSVIQKFYENKTILLTGGTGFLGKLTVEKLLRTCNTKKILLLMRSKRGVSTSDRLEAYFDSPMFEILSSQKPDFRQKIAIIPGDIQRPNLGLDPEDLEVITREVEVIFHWAATVNFTENLKVATDINVKSVRDLLVMAKNMPRLKSYLHVSTAYSHCLLKEIHETFYDDTLEGKKLITCMDVFNEKTAEDVTAGLLGEWPNSYVYTKSAAENLIRTEGIGLPIGIHRPSIVTASYKEPLSGWVDNWNGLTGLLTSAGLGFFRAGKINENLKLNIVPSDYVVNSAIAAAWQVSEKDKNEISIYNFTDGCEHVLRTGEIMHVSHIERTKIPSSKMVWHYFMINTTSDAFLRILNYFLNYLPAYLMDIIFVCLRKRPVFLKIYNKVDKMMGAMQYFANNEWCFDNSNVVGLWKSMCKEDRELFEFDMSALNWSDYLQKYARGCRVYLLKDPMETIPEGRRKLRKMRILHYTLVAFLLFALYYILSCILNVFV